MSEALADFQVNEKDAYVGTTLAGRYRILRKIGGGGMGAVYEAEHTMLGRRVAVKVLHTQFAHNADVVRRFMNEARAAALLAHKNILACTDVGQHDDGSPFLVLDLLHGRSLADVVAEGRPIPIARVVHIVKQICAALTAAHAKGIVHRDMKPDNVFLETGEDVPPDHVKVLDFGISKFTAGSEGGTKTGSMLGTPIYMSPEQFNDSSRVDLRTDVYSVGAILFELLTGHPPYEATTLPEIMMKVVTEATPDVTHERTDVPRALADVIQRAMAKSVDTRFGSTAELASALGPFAALDVAPVYSDSRKVVPASPLGFGTDDTLLADSAVRPRSSASLAGTGRSLVVPRPPLWKPLAIGGVAALLVLGAIALGMRASSPEGTATPTEVSPGSPTGTAAASLGVPPVAEVRVAIVAPDPGATVTLRGGTHLLPYVDELEPGTAPELVEITAPGCTGRRYGVTLDRARTLWVDLDTGVGVRTATDSELALALAGTPMPITEVTEEPPPTQGRSTGSSRRSASGDGTTRDAPPALLPP